MNALVNTWYNSLPIYGDAGMGFPFQAKWQGSDGKGSWRAYKCSGIQDAFFINSCHKNLYVNNVKVMPSGWLVAKWTNTTGHKLKVHDVVSKTDYIIVEDGEQILMLNKPDSPGNFLAIPPGMENELISVQYATAERFPQWITPSETQNQTAPPDILPDNVKELFEKYKTQLAVAAMLLLIILIIRL